MTLTGHYNERGPASPPHVRHPPLDDDAYGRALDTLVKGCVDVLLLDLSDPERPEAFVPTRCIPPHPAPWMLGGRMMAGEHPAQTAERVLGREAGFTHLTADAIADRWTFAGVFTYVWKERVQAPQENGAADVVLTFTLSITPEERDHQLRLDPHEYATANPVEAWRSVQDIHQDATLHPALRAVAGAVCPV